MSTGDIRRAQLVAPFGVGAMSVLVNGTSVITGGLDHWYPTKKADPNYIPSEYQTHDWRLESRLQVSEFRLPPDYRPHYQGDEDPRNTNLKIAALRFPLMHFCMYCKRLEETSPTLTSRYECPDDEHKDWKYHPRMAQVPFVIACSKGHLDDFPFREWVHKSLHPSCKKILRLKSSGGGLEGQVVQCECGKRRSLAGIMQERKNSGETTLSTDLAGGEGNEFLCRGAMPWLQDAGDGMCKEYVRGALRGSGNIYFPKVESSIYLPVESGAVPASAKALLDDPKVESILETTYDDWADSASADFLYRKLTKGLQPEVIGDVTKEEFFALYRERFGIGSNIETDNEEDGTAVDLLTGDDIWRYPEYQQIRETPQDVDLTASDPGMHPDLVGLLGRVRAVETLRETRAMRGFTRLNDTPLGLAAGKRMLRRTSLAPEHDWLPAYVVRGEGIYLELDSDQLEAWEQKPAVKERAQLITQHYGIVAAERGLDQHEFTPRFIMLHTLAHLLINKLVFACGYSSASLRERLYVSSDTNKAMAGLLIYTAAGDSEGTMGGLVRMSSPSNINSVVQAALADATWCSTDPVCMDAGKRGQGTDSCNLAACHGCALVPETSCEEFNRFLDRGLVIGTFEDPEMGYFSDLVR